MLEQRYTHTQMIALVVLRVMIGWHFLYEGIAKLQKDEWSAAGFLRQSKGVFAGFYRWIADSPDILNIVNFLNMWGLTIIGLFLILGFFTRLAAVCGALLVLLYYFANPPFVGYFYALPTEGSYLIVNKNLVEVAGLIVLAVTFSGRYVGLDRLVHRLFSRRAPVQERELSRAGAPV
jgi:thiosulfate dehydrogenase (quinone) large subunit